MEYGLVVLWLAAYAWLAIAGLPVAGAVFARFSDRGAGLALPVALATLWVVAYWVGHLANVVEGLAFGYPALAAGLAVLLVLDAVALRRGVAIDWDGYLRVLAVFAAAFLLLVLIRSLDPAAWPGGGEKFLDFGLLASSLRATALPPEDMWFAGEPVQYYYGGHMLASLLARLTATPAVYAYNLALAGYYAAYVSAAYGLAGAVAAARDRSYHAAGLTAAFLVGLASNLSTAGRLVVWLLPGKGGERFAALVGLEMKGLALGPGAYNYWFASRVIPGTINEFPFFAWLNGDMHAHMMVPPFLLLVAGLLFAYYRTPAAAVWRRRLLVGLVVPVAGVVAVVSTWAFPTVGGLTWLALTFGAGHPADLLVGRDRAPEDRRAATLGTEAVRALVALVVAAGVVLAGVLSVAPFFLGTASGRGVGLLPDRSPLGALLLVHGAFLLVSALYLRDRLPAVDGRTRRRLALGWVTLLGVSALYQATAVALFVPLLAVGWWLLRRTDRVGFEVVLLVAVAGVLLLVEFAFVKEQAGPGRMNTVFKTYAQVWALWATAAGVMFTGVDHVGEAWAAARADLRDAVARVWYRGRARAANGGQAGRRFGRPEHWRAVFALALVVSLSLYSVAGMASAVDNGRAEPSLDARDYLREHHPGEVRAIEWLDDRPGQPTIATAPGVRIYGWVNGPSSLTGVPTVAGWAHEIGYRGPDAYFRRVRDVNVLFNGTAERRADLVERYDIDYVYVGPVERERYGAGSLDFENESWVADVRRMDAVEIYVVEESPTAAG